MHQDVHDSRVCYDLKYLGLKSPLRLGRGSSVEASVQASFDGSSYLTGHHIKDIQCAEHLIGAENQLNYPLIRVRAM